MKSAIELYEYQKRWILDESRFKEGRWARQTGKSFASAAGIVLDARSRKTKWVCISSGERQVKEFMEKIRLHAEITERVLKWNEEVYGYTHPDGHREEYKVLECIMRNGSKIIGLPANPDTARGYSANVYLDEFSTHRNSREMWAAVFPIVSRAGYRLWITYTPNGKQNMAYDVSINPVFSHHVVDIYQAVRAGCPQNIKELRLAINDADLWAQEYEVKFLDEATAFLTYDLINSIESDSAGKPEHTNTGPIYVGMDIARRGDLTVIWVLELIGDVLWTREVVEMRHETFRAQEEELERIYRRYRPVRICMDQTGMGEKFVEDAKRRFGEYVVEGVIFTTPVKTDLAHGLRRCTEDRRVRIPVDRKIRDDLHSVKKITTSSGNIRFDVERSEKHHADRFWALALAIHAAERPYQPVEYQSVQSRKVAAGHEVI